MKIENINDLLSDMNLNTRHAMLNHRSIIFHNMNKDGKKQVLRKIMFRIRYLMELKGYNGLGVYGYLYRYNDNVKFLMKKTLDMLNYLRMTKETDNNKLYEHLTSLGVIDLLYIYGYTIRMFDTNECMKYIELKTFDHELGRIRNRYG